MFNEVIITINNRESVQTQLCKNWVCVCMSTRMCFERKKNSSLSGRQTVLYTLFLKPWSKALGAYRLESLPLPAQKHFPHGVMLENSPVIISLY